MISCFNIAYQIFTQPSDGIRNNGRTMVVNQLVETDGYYTMNFAELEQLVKDPANKILIMANPYNPTSHPLMRKHQEVFFIYQKNR